MESGCEWVCGGEGEATGKRGNGKGNGDEVVK